MGANARSRVLKHFTGTVVLGVAACLIVAYEVRASVGARTGQAMVVGTGITGYWRSGQTIGEVEHRVDGRWVKATVRAWYSRPKAGEQINVIYAPDDPQNVRLDGFWQQHCSSVLALSAFTIMALAELLAFNAWRRRQSWGLTRG